MQTSFRRIFCTLSLLLGFIAAGPALKAYPVSVTINVTLTAPSSGSDPLGLAGDSATITATLDSALPVGGSATFPNTSILVTVPALGLSNAGFTGTLTVSSSGEIVGTNFTDSTGHNQFNPSVSLAGVSFPGTIPTAFGSAAINSASSSASYTILGTSGEVGLTGTVNATGLTVSPQTPLSASYQVGGAAPADAQIAIGSNGAPASYTVALSPTSASSFLNLSSTSGTTPGNLNVSFNTGVTAGTYTASIEINAGGIGAPVTIPVTYTVTAGGGGGGTGGFAASPSTVLFNYTIGGTTPGPQTVTLTAPAASAFTATATVPWLTVSASPSTTPSTLTITFNPAGLSAGTAGGAIDIASAAGSLAIPVTAVISTAGSGGGSTLQLSPASLSFTFSGGATTQSQTVNVAGTTGTNYTVSVASGSFLSVTPASGTTPGTVTVTADSTKITGGSATGAIQFTALGATTTLSVTATISGTPPASASLSASPLAVSFVYPATSASPLTQTVAISGTAAVSFTASTQTPWLSVTPASGTTNGNITITVNPTGLATGLITGSVTITSANAINSPLTIPVRLDLTQAPPAVISAAPTAIAFAYQTGQAVPASQTVAITASPAGASYTVSGFGASWLSVALSADLSTATLSVNPAGLSAGVYVGSVKIGGSGLISPVFVPVTLTISGAATLGASPTTLSFISQSGGPAPASQTIAIVGSTAGNFTVASDSAWLAVTPATGTTPGTVTVTATAGNFANGTYRGNISFTPAGASQATVTVPVILNVGTQIVPIISAVTNGISYLTQVGAPGLIVSLFGQNLGPATPAPLQVANATVSSSIGGTQVFADGIPCPLLFASNEQVNAILPFALEGQTSTQIELQYQGVTSNAFTLPVQPAAPALFSADSTGQGGGAILNADLSVNSASNPAAPGSVVALYGGGGGATTPAGSDGLIISTAPFPVPTLPATVTVGGQAASIAYYGQAPALVSGVLQINITLPAGLASGPQPVVVTIGGVSSAANLNVYVQ